MAHHFFIVSFVPVAQLDRVSDYESEGRGFESLRARHLQNSLYAGSRMKRSMPEAK
ncbi:hypothetical protein CULT_2640003 [[Clostridium] ultunense Esp]|nr:hypothetical protein CULT_2640003 [[Clostridium] ultunense Esp]